MTFIYMFNLLGMSHNFVFLFFFLGVGGERGISVQETGIISLRSASIKTKENLFELMI